MTGASRADRVRVERRLALAHRGADLLRRKRTILEDELERLRIAADRQREELADASREAEVWLARAAALDGATGIARAAPRPDAVARLTWSTTMGVRFPAEAEVDLPPEQPTSGSSALAFAARAHRAAVEAAVRSAASEEAVRCLGAELDQTRMRERAVERRWVPRLESEHAAITRRLDDLELEESLRVRWSADRQVDQQRGRSGNE